MATGGMALPSESNRSSQGRASQRRASVDKAKQSLAAGVAAARRGSLKVAERLDKGVRSIEDLVLEPEEGSTPAAAPVGEEDDAPLLDLEVIVVLARNDRGLGLVFDSQFFVTKMVPGCAARESGEIEIGDRLLAVDGKDLQLGDSIASYFPFGEQSFELKLLRKQTPKKDKGKDRRRRIERVKKEPSGKYFPGRAGAVFEEVQWNDYCVLFPDGTSMPFNEDVRYTSLTGYLRKQKVMNDGRADFTVHNGAQKRGWVRHFIHLSIQKLAWFDEDPQKKISRVDVRAAPPPASVPLRQIDSTATERAHSALALSRSSWPRELTADARVATLLRRPSRRSSPRRKASARRFSTCPVAASTARASTAISSPSLSPTTARLGPRVHAPPSCSCCRCSPRPPRPRACPAPSALLAPVRP